MPQPQLRRLFLTGATGYLGSHLAAALVERGHEVRALTRQNSVHGVPDGTRTVIGDALDASSYSSRVMGCDTFIHLVGTSHPSPWKKDEFQRVDLGSLRAALSAAMAARVPHFVYVSVAHPAPVMKTYIQVREQCEKLIQVSGLNASIVRPWYILGPGHRWPYVLIPAYRLAEMIAATRAGAQRLGLVTLEQMIQTMVAAIEAPARGVRVAEVPQIRLGEVGRAMALARTA